MNLILESMKGYIPLDLVVNKVMSDHAKVCARTLMNGRYLACDDASATVSPGAIR